MKRIPGQWAVLSSGGAALAVSLLLLASSPYATYTTTITPDGVVPAVVRGASGFIETNGLRALPILVVPVVLAGMPLLFRERRAVLWSGAASSALLLLLAVLAAMSVGWLLLPSAALMAVATLIAATRGEAWPTARSSGSV